MLCRQAILCKLLKMDSDMHHRWRRRRDSDSADYEGGWPTFLRHSNCRDDAFCRVALGWTGECARRYAGGFVIHKLMCNTLHMPTNLALDDKLIEQAQRAGKHRTKREAVNAALAEYVQRRKQMRILEAFGSFEFDPDYDYKAERRRRRS